MKTITLLFLTITAAIAQNNTPIDPTQFKEPVRLTCVGDSITQGVGAERGKSWPSQAQKMLGLKWAVTNCGRSGATLMNTGDRPYIKTPQYKKALSSKPNVVVILLGTNDTKPQNWKNFEKDYEKSYRSLIADFQNLPTKPRIFLALPPYIAKNGKWGINNKNTLAQAPIIQKLAKELKLGVIDVYGSLEGKDELIPDTVHPNTKGATQIATAVTQALSGKKAPTKAPAKTK